MARKKIAGMDVSALLNLRDAIDARLHSMRDTLAAQLAAIGGSGGKKRGRPSKMARSTHALAGRKAPAKFRDPKSGVTWAGRGMTPRWLAAYEASGRSRNEFAAGAVLAAVVKSRKKRARPKAARK